MNHRRDRKPLTSEFTEVTEGINGAAQEEGIAAVAALPIGPQV